MKILKTNGSLMKVESIAECSPCYNLDKKAMLLCHEDVMLPMSTKTLMFSCEKKKKISHII